MVFFESQQFKNYKALCEYLGEEVKGGDAKRAQINRWKTMFDFKTEGYKIIITEVYNNEEQIVTRGNNHKNMDIYLPYIHNCLYEGFKDHMSISYIATNMLNILNPDILWEEDCSDDFRHWINNVRLFISNNIETTLNYLERTGEIEYKVGYAFISRPKRTAYMTYTTKYNDYIQYVEERVCNVLNDKYHISNSLKGRQLKFIIHKSKKYFKKYWRGVLAGIKANNELMKELQQSADERYHGVQFGSEKYPIDNYWKIWEITGVSCPKYTGSREDYINLIIEKTAKKGEIPQTWIDSAFNIDKFKAQ